MSTLKYHKYIFKLYLSLFTVSLLSCSSVKTTGLQNEDDKTVPQNVAVAIIGKTLVVTWDDVVNAEYYYVYKDTKANVSKADEKFESTMSPFTYTNVVVGKKYYFRVSATINGEEGELSKEVSAKVNETVSQNGMVLIPSKDKTFIMGQPDSTIGAHNNSNNEQPEHEVEFTYDFWMDSTEVTQKSYKNLLGVNPSKTQGDALPVTNCTWYDALLYCNARSKKEGYDTVYTYHRIIGTAGDSALLEVVEYNKKANGYRLPTEAEWEFACGGNFDSWYYWGDKPDGAYANGNEKYGWPDDGFNEILAPVGSLRPNMFGLYDMLGNVYELCHDRYLDYEKKKVYDPNYFSTEGTAVMRGASFFNDSTYLRITARYRAELDETLFIIGFRCVLPKK